VSSTLCTYAHSINLAPPGTALKKNQLLGTLTDDEMKVFIDYAFPCSFDVGADIITQGDAGDFFYIIRSGTVEYFVDGKKQTYVGQKHDSFGELALLRDVPRAATTRAKTACDLFKISRDSFRYAIAAAAQENSNSAYDAIKSVKIFENLSDQQLKDVSKVCMAVNMRAKTTIFKKGDPGSIFYIIQSGSVMMSDIGENMTDVTLEAGQTFGEKALMTKEKRNATATTASETTLLEIDREDFEKILGPLADAISKSQNIRILEATELLKNLGADEKEQVISMFTEQAFKKGTKILDEGKADSTFYLVKEGEVSMSTKDAGEKEIEILVPGTAFNLAALMPKSEGLKWPTCIAVTDVVCFQLASSDLQNVVGAGFASLAGKAYEARQAELNSAKKVDIKKSQLKEIAKLGQGTFGRVSLVQDTVGKKVFALKALHKKEVVEYQQQANVMNEKNIMLMCHHPFILALHNTYKDEHKLYMLLEYCNGGELFGRLHTNTRDGVTKAEHAKFYCGCCTMALGYLLQRKIIYRDLKPENMLVDKMGYVKVIDFGFAKICDNKAYTLCGTPEYMAPEIILGRGYDISVDWWALGVLIYECLAGQSPFAARDQNTICRKIVQRSYSCPKTSMFTKDAVDIIDKLLQAKGPDRLASGPSGASPVKNHPWFADIDWNGLLAKTEKAPWIPKVKDDLDTSNFDSYGVDDSFDKRWHDPSPGWEKDF
jgi:CRP-like cAMP-binding protein